MATKTVAAKNPRDPLTKERIVDVAIEFADSRGIEALSMRKLASELNAGAMSLYNHVADKDELFAAMVDLVVAEIDPPAEVNGSAEPDRWRKVMRASAISAHEAYLAHPWSIEVAMRTPPGPTRMRYIESVLAAFANSGLEPDLAHHAYHSYEIHISGFTLSQIAFRFDEAELKQLASAFLSEIDASEFPNLVAHVHEHLDDRGSDFEFGLDLLLDGFERLRSAPSPSSATP